MSGQPDGAGVRAAKREAAPPADAMALAPPAGDKPAADAGASARRRRRRGGAPEPERRGALKIKVYSKGIFFIRVTKNGTDSPKRSVSDC